MQLNAEHSSVHYQASFMKKKTTVNKIMIQNADVTFSFPNQHDKIQRMFPCLYSNTLGCFRNSWAVSQKVGHKIQGSVIFLFPFSECYFYAAVVTQPGSFECLFTWCTFPHKAWLVENKVYHLL